MARVFHFHDQHPRARTGRSARQASLILMFLLLAVVAALWMTGTPNDSLLPTAPPA